MNAEQDKVAELEGEWPQWQFWVVYRYQGGPVWCARRWEGERSVLNAGGAAVLGRSAGRAGGLVRGTTANE